ncbi:hypothetical protein PABG_11456 [Paracoccidioides brasiliensis Pb03]|uniref:DOMON domain-containing protein n=1 Tax=Paracoccidioides brasiliensis (strain Pb18) TaxID=502780 RepID=C1G0E8_PARBD|nr:uncharacterized protein PADG_00338 [Paracoccidioides brasiliensis Pb18]EEH44049.2 hypothetical protein PADG_00338 [Paracoccidioides brasiliensis Pb18]KGY15471.1 hypothetical protein PABG_11456 [Paracoccidioides brasiliensis Pb03]
MRLFPTAVAAATLASMPVVHGQTAQFRPSDAKGIFYSLTIPPSTASRGEGLIFFTMEAPSDGIQWFALGQGRGMTGSNIFVAYASSPTNITVSPRLGVGHIEPEYNPSARISLLEGSGISNGKMIANVRCDNCMKWEGGSMSPTDRKSPWIWAMKAGNPLNSADVREQISFHDNMGTFSLDLSNPSDGGSGGSGSATPGVSQKTINVKSVTHGIIMSVVFVILLPTFALGLFLITYPQTASRIHAPLQLLTVCGAIAGFGVGVSLARDLGKTAMYHPIIGYVVIAWLSVFQPLLGYLHHRHYVRMRKGSVMGFVHRWVGRAMLILAIVNGGLGFKFAGIGSDTAPKVGVIVYGAIAGFMGVIYVAVATWGTARNRKERSGSDASLFGANEMKDGANRR